jgi:hypothetical protein
VRLGDVAGGPWSRGIWVGLGADVAGMMFMYGMVWYGTVVLDVLCAVITCARTGLISSSVMTLRVRKAWRKARCMYV